MPDITSNQNTKIKLARSLKIKKNRDNTSLFLVEGLHHVGEAVESGVDIDFILHFSDIIGIYAQLGLDFVSKMMFGDYVDHHKSYFDRNGNLGPNYPVHEQLAQYFSGEILNVDRSVDYNNLRVKVYATRQGTKYFIMVLNKDVDHEATIRITLLERERLDLKVRLPCRSYTSLIIDDDNITISGV